MRPCAYRHRSDDRSPRLSRSDALFAVLAVLVGLGTAFTLGGLMAHPFG